MRGKRALLLAFVLMLLGGCATMPTGPMVPVMPGPGKPFEVFMADDTVCRQWAWHQIGGTSPSQTANENLATGATVGALVGGAMGAAIGAATGNPAAGAAIGGATGLLGGTAMGSNAGAASEYQLQRRYDIAYQQCMYAKGNQIPGARQQARAYPPPPPPPHSQTGPWVVIPGQYVNGTWVPEHRVQVPYPSGGEAPVPGPTAPQSGTQPPLSP